MDNSKCGKFTPNNMDKFLNDTIKYFQANVTKSKDKKLKRVCTYQGATNDKVTTLDTYYISFINDCISDLRKGRMTYVFSISHIWEILRFVQNIKAVYQGNGIIGLICNDEICENKSKI